MELSAEQRRGIKERFAVLIDHNRDSLDALLVEDASRRHDWYVQIRQNIEACCDEVLLLIEHIEPKEDTNG